MANRFFRYGQLNPVVHPNRGRTLDPTTTSGIESLSRVAKADTTPRFLDKMRGPLRGIVIEELDDSSPGLFDLISATFTGKKELPRYRVRIPELHAHLPEPLFYGPNGVENNYSILNMYPIFEALTPNVAKAAGVGSIVYVDFLDRERFLEPVYLGPIEIETPGYNAGADQNSVSSRSVSNSAGSVKLAANQPSGENQTPTISSYGQEMSLVTDGDLDAESQEAKVAKNTAKSYSDTIRRSQNAAILPARSPNGYALPVDEPAYVTSYYGQLRDIGTSPHVGIDLRAAVGDPVRAIDDGTIRGARYTKDGGNILYINHGIKGGNKKMASQYLHLSAYAEGIRLNSEVKAGQIIGYAGATGKISGPHLHLDILINGSRVDPGPYIEAAKNNSRELASSE